MRAFEAVIIEAVRTNNRTEKMFIVITKFYSAMPEPLRGAVAAVPSLSDSLLEEDIRQGDVEALITTYSQHPTDLYWIWDHGALQTVLFEDFSTFLRQWKLNLT